jgi:DNA-directed RNA polymerase subunit RPC12/RpoP
VKITCDCSREVEVDDLGGEIQCECGSWLWYRMEWSIHRTAPSTWNFDAEAFGKIEFKEIEKLGLNIEEDGK